MFQINDVSPFLSAESPVVDVENNDTEDQQSDNFSVNNEPLPDTGSPANQFYFLMNTDILMTIVNFMGKPCNEINRHKINIDPQMRQSFLQQITTTCIC